MEAFRRVSLDSGLMLHAAADLRLDPAALQADYAALDAALPDGERLSFGAAPGTGWTSIPLTNGRDPCPALAWMPGFRAFLEQRQDWRIDRSHLLRQPPGGKLRWHFDNKSLHWDETRLLIPIHAPPGSVTLIGHEAAAYPEGQCWTGDFGFPHQVENPGDRDRIVIVIDVRSDESVAAFFPPELAAEPALRVRLAREAQNLMVPESVY